MTPQASSAIYWLIEIPMRTKYVGVSVDGAGCTFPPEGDRTKLCKEERRVFVLLFVNKVFVSTEK